jgi:hypothetical protein
MNPEDEVTPANINNIYCDVQENKADPLDVRRVLKYFCILVEERRKLPDEIQIFLKNGFRTFLDGNAGSVDQAIGLIRKKVGRPPPDETERAILAAAVLEARIAGTRHQEALEDVAEDYGCKKTKVGEAWKNCKGQAIPMLQYIRQCNDEDPLTEPEWAEVRKIFKKDHSVMERWFSDQPPTITPEN